LFYLHQKKNAVDAHKIICEMHDENFVVIRTYALV